VINPDWVEQAPSGADSQIREELDPDKRMMLSIPDGLWLWWKQHRGGSLCGPNQVVLILVRGV